MFSSAGIIVPSQSATSVTCEPGIVCVVSLLRFALYNIDITVFSYILEFLRWKLPKFMLLHAHAPHVRSELRDARVDGVSSPNYLVRVKKWEIVSTPCPSLSPSTGSVMGTRVWDIFDSSLKTFYITLHSSEVSIESQVLPITAEKPL